MDQRQKPVKQSKKAREAYEADLLEKCRVEARKEARAEVREFAVVAGATLLGLMHGFAPFIRFAACSECDVDEYGRHTGNCSKRRWYVPLSAIATNGCSVCKQKPGELHLANCTVRR